MVDIFPVLMTVRDRFSNPEIKEKFRDVMKKIQFDFSDTKEQYLLSIENGNAALSKESVNAPDILVSTTTDILAGIIDKKVNPVIAYSTRKIKVKGSMEDLLKLQKLLI
ncbi:MAG: SCP2 sterol-binding domain-containing protein [Thermoplasmata archaeon]